VVLLTDVVDIINNLKDEYPDKYAAMVEFMRELEKRVLDATGVEFLCVLNFVAANEFQLEAETTEFVN